MKQAVYLFLLVLFGFSCNTQHEVKYSDIGGLWKVTLKLDSTGKELPFFLEIIEVQGQLKAAIWNGREKIEHDSVVIQNDSVYVVSPYFNSTLVLSFNRNTINGYWQDGSRANYKIPLSGKYNLTQRFKFDGPLEETMDGKWEVRFSPGTNKEYPGIGLFATDENSMQATFLTETGDYRFLEGGFAANELKLSTFDGAHAFLFEANLDGDTLKGWFYSGKHFKESFIAWRNDSAMLQSPYVLTELTDPSAPISFGFNNLSGEMVSSTDTAYTNRPMLVQIMGSWCPNCMDEAAFLVEHKEEIEKLGIEVIALSFERATYEDAVPTIQKLKNSLGIEYPILYAGKANKSEATKQIPWLKEIKSYPTLLYVLPNKHVFKIHTGFYGPGTGMYYDKQSQEMLDDMRQLASMSGTIQ